MDRVGLRVTTEAAATSPMYFSRTRASGRGCDGIRRRTILTNDEKVLARTILRAAHAVEVPSPQDLAEQAGVDLDTVREGLATLTWLGFLTRDCGRLRLAARHRQFLDGCGLGS